MSYITNLTSCVHVLFLCSRQHFGFFLAEPLDVWSMRHVASCCLGQRLGKVIIILTFSGVQGPSINFNLVLCLFWNLSDRKFHCSQGSWMLGLYPGHSFRHLFLQVEITAHDCDLCRTFVGSKLFFPRTQFFEKHVSWLDHALIPLILKEQ